MEQKLKDIGQRDLVSMDEDHCLKKAETQEETSFSVKHDGVKRNIPKTDGALKSAVSTGNVITDTNVEEGGPEKTMHEENGKRT